MTSTLQKVLIGIAAMVVLGCLVVGLLLGSAVYGWKAALRAGNEAATLQNIKTVAAVEIQYYNTHNRTFGTFDQLIKEDMLTSRFSGERTSTDGYVFTLNVTPKTAVQASSYTLNSDPQNANTGTNHFYIDSRSAEIHTNPNQPASATDPLYDK
jgi:Tfp pilus assembly protein PilE